MTNYSAGSLRAFGNSYSPDGQWIAMRIENRSLNALFQIQPNGNNLQMTDYSTFRPRGMAWGSECPAPGDIATYLGPDVTELRGVGSPGLLSVTRTEPDELEPATLIESELPDFDESLRAGRISVSQSRARCEPATKVSLLKAVRCADLRRFICGDWRETARHPPEPAV